MEFNENSNRRVYNFDLDGILTDGELFWKQEPSPNHDNINILRNLYKMGNIIIIWTARQWELAPETVGWLIKNRVPFHGIYMAKGGSDNYIDDKNKSLVEIISDMHRKTEYETVLREFGDI
jgi:trehalose-6-phosphatase